MRQQREIQSCKLMSHLLCTCMHGTALLLLSVGFRSLHSSHCYQNLCQGVIKESKVLKRKRKKGKDTRGRKNTLSFSPGQQKNLEKPENYIHNPNCPKK